MCNCIKAAIEKGYVIRGGDYDDEIHDFVDTNVFWMPVLVRNDKGKKVTVNLSIKHCPICGNKLPD